MEFKALMTILLGITLGMMGQGMRSVIGIKKARERSGRSRQEWFDKDFDAKGLMLSFVIGGIAGGLAAIMLYGREINQEYFLGILAAGYAGTDFIQGVMKARMPNKETTAKSARAVEG